MRYWRVYLLFFICFSIKAQDDKFIIGERKLQDTLFIIKKDTINLNQLLQSVKPTPAKWKRVNKVGVNISEIAFVNWNAGGNNSVSALANTTFERKYKFKNVQWTNEMILKYGVNIQEGQKIRKTDDALQINSTFGARPNSNTSWYFSAKGNFNTQFSNGYRYPNTDNPISRFMAPGYFFLGVGGEYAPDKKDLTIYLSPLTQKSTFVLDQTLADAGAFGVRAAEYDADGNKIRGGQKVYTEVGILVTNSYQTKVYENMFFSNKLTLYTDYINSFGNVDVNWIMDFELRVNEYVKADLGVNIIYDDDVKFKEFTEEDGTVIPYGARIQLKQLLGVGVVYNF
ncbi:DUF3078 domain-containing protein [Robertkochia solimangrovi]|uniref:DUF3078 domain-containing protein n=1 Tax=Robertkochia solimangrovi TaxID=2213046 RepID=UPI001180739B|nr:DUF3078 domain-containing protein [Robertkochia solimangrovi]TRZ45928.1 hypothetical protein DMZ48_01240 [Robertkochia solimangrovi]